MGWMKLNSDGSAFENPGRAGGGGIISNHDENWVQGYARRLGHTSSLIAELWALRDGLIMARELGLNNLIVELVALSVLMLMNNDSTNLLMEPLLIDCKNLLKEIPKKRVVHTYREANQHVDALAKSGANSFSSFVVFCNPLSVVERILAFDKASMQCNRLVSFSIMHFQGLPKKEC